MVFRLRERLDDGAPGRASTVFARSPKAPLMIGLLALACFVSGGITAWMLRTGFVMAQISSMQP